MAEQDDAQSPNSPAPALPVQYRRWDDMEWETVTDTIRRKLVHGPRMMIAHVFLDEGAIVPRHSHENEQITYILSGALHFKLGADLEHEVIVRAGEVLYIPANLPHEAVALEDTLDVDIFDPPRQDWLDGSDGYFHKKG